MLRSKAINNGQAVQISRIYRKLISNNWTTKGRCTKLTSSPKRVGKNMRKRAILVEIGPFEQHARTQLYGQSDGCYPFLPAMARFCPTSYRPLTVCTENYNCMNWTAGRRLLPSANTWGGGTGSTAVSQRRAFIDVVSLFVNTECVDVCRGEGEGDTKGSRCRGTVATNRSQ